MPVEPNAIREKAEAEGNRLAGTPRWRVSFTGAKPQPPQLVRGATASARKYYIVDFRIDTRSTGRIIFNATTGAVGQIAGLRDGQKALPRFLTPPELPKVVSVKSSPHEETVLRDFRVQPELFWAPSDQSSTPFQPFYVITKGRIIAYLRVDGEAFGRITRNGGGG